MVSDMAVTDLSHLVPGLAVSSQGGGNTVSDTASLSQTAPGSEGVDSYVPPATDRLPAPVAPAADDYARLIAEDGSKGSRGRS